MKNIFLKETDQESELYYNTHANVYGHSKNVLSMGGWVVNKFIYITNNEEIKFDDYITDGYKVWKWKDDCSLLGRKKVVLTNDPTLIEDGVQQVNSSFLSFYAENTPDYVEVIKELNETDYNICVDYTYSYSLNFSPKENREQSSKTEENIIDQWLEKNGNPEIAKQVEEALGEIFKEELELEEVAKNYSEYNEQINKAVIEAVKFGAKWQAERMYSEEEVLEQLNLLYSMKNSLVDTFTDENDYITMKWFDKNKKQ